PSIHAANVSTRQHSTSATNARFLRRGSYKPQIAQPKPSAAVIPPSTENDRNISPRIPNTKAAVMPPTADVLRGYCAARGFDQPPRGACVSSRYGPAP